MIDPDLSLIIDVFKAIIEHKQHKMYTQTFNTIQRIVMTLPGPSKTEETPEFRMSLESRERLLSLFSEVTHTDQGSKQDLDEMSQIKVL